MNILFLSIVNLNNINEQGIYTDLLREFNRLGHKLYVIMPREKRHKLETEYVEESGINFLKVKIGNITKTTNIIEKGISTIKIEYHYLRQLKKYLNEVKFDLVLYTTPPITF